MGSPSLRGKADEASSAGDALACSHVVGTTAAASRPGRADSDSGATSAADLLRSSIRRLYDKQNLKVTEDVLPAFINSDLIDEPTKLGSGAFHSVYAVKLEGSDGNPFDGVFKPLGSKEDLGRACGGHTAGIRRDDPQTAMRNLATLAYAEYLGLDVIPDTRLGVLGTGQESAKLGLVMERASGTAAADADPSVFGRADVAAEVSKIQLLDHLTGQGDRHSGNYFIDAEPGQPVKVTGIDNDQAFGSRITRPESIRYASDSAHIGFRGTKLPPVVDREMASAINALSRSDIRQMLGDKLSESEVQAAISRHQGVTQHIAKLAEQGMIISPSQWGRSSTQKLLTAENSYVGRDREAALAKQARDRARAQAEARPGR